MVKDKIKALLAIQNISQTELAKKRGISLQQFNLKISRNAFKPKELIQLAIDTNTQLAFIDKNGKPLIIFDETDLEQKKEK